MISKDVVKSVYKYGSVIRLFRFSDPVEVPINLNFELCNYSISVYEGILWYGLTNVNLRNFMDLFVYLTPLLIGVVHQHSCLTVTKN